MNKLAWNTFRWDANADGAFTISDLWGLFQWAACWPGNAALVLLEEHIPSVATFLEIDASSMYGWLAWIVAGIAWLFAISIIDNSTRAPNA